MRPALYKSWKVLEICPEDAAVGAQCAGKVGHRIPLTWVMGLLEASVVPAPCS